jgi:branched-subunit amino acid transport protein AzlD
MTLTKPKMSASYKAIFILSIFMVFFVMLAGAATNSKTSGFGMWIWGYTAWLMYKRRNADLVSFYKFLLWFDVIAAGVALAVLTFSDSDVSKYVGYTAIEAIILFAIVISLTFGLYKYFLSLESNPTSSESFNVADSTIWDQVSEEVKSGKRVDSLWTRAFSETDGDSNKANARYIKLRFDQIKLESRGSSSPSNVSSSPKASTKVKLTVFDFWNHFNTLGMLALLGILLLVGYGFLGGNMNPLYQPSKSSKEVISQANTAKSSPVNDVKQVCYVYWDGLSFQLGKTEGDKFSIYMKQFYGVDRLEFALPKETVKYLMSQPSNAKLEQIDVADNFLTSNWQRVSTICQFS